MRRCKSFHDCLFGVWNRDFRFAGWNDGSIRKVADLGIDELAKIHIANPAPARRIATRVEGKALVRDDDATIDVDTVLRQLRECCLPVRYRPGLHGNVAMIANASCL